MAVQLSTVKFDEHLGYGKGAYKGIQLFRVLNPEDITLMLQVLKEWIKLIAVLVVASLYTKTTGRASY
jgi:hypothetical protein